MVFLFLLDPSQVVYVEGKAGGNLNFKEYVDSLVKPKNHTKESKITKMYHKLNIDTKQTTFKVDK